MSQREGQKSESRQRIVRSAVSLLRRRGLAEVSVADVMAGAGMTVGGFYAHFQSKQDLAEAAVRQAMHDRREQFLARQARGGRLRSAMRAYFTEDHRDDVAGRCPMPMAAMDAARGGSPAFADELAKMADAFAAGQRDRDAALGSLALMVGGMILAHATNGTPLSGEVLRSATRYGAAALSGMS